MLFTSTLTSVGLVVGLSLLDVVAAGGTNYIFTYGDSYTTTGFNVSGNKPSPFNALGNPDYPGQTTAGTGLPNWVDKLTYDHNPSGYYTFTYNYAVGSACVNDTRYYTTRVPNFIAQTGNFAFTQPGFTADQAVAIPYWGTNDIYLHSTQLNTTDNGVISATMDDYFNQIEIMYNVGVRYFVFLLADRECFPLACSWSKLTETNSRGTHPQSRPELVCPDSLQQPRRMEQATLVPRQLFRKHAPLGQGLHP